MNPSDNETERIIGDQSFLPRTLRVTGFILDANIGFQVDSAGIVFGFHRAPKGAFQSAQLKLVGTADVVFPERLPAQANVSRVHYQDLFLPIVARAHFFYIVNKSDQKFLIWQ